MSIESADNITPESLRARFQLITKTHIASRSHDANLKADDQEPPDVMLERITKLETQMEGVKDALKDLKDELRSGNSDLKSDIANLRSDAATNLRWMIGLGVTVGGILIGLLVRVMTLLPSH
ncbi:hypothetical protein [Gluconobacter oxydans]|nr:hypothetical protein [Gluconobacter oxydans]